MVVVKDVMPVFPRLRVFSGITHIWCSLKIFSFGGGWFRDLGIFGKKKQRLCRKSHPTERKDPEKNSQGKHLSNKILKKCFEVGDLPKSSWKMKASNNNKNEHLLSIFYLLIVLPASPNLLLVSKL